MLTTGFKLFSTYAIVAFLTALAYGLATGNFEGDNYLGVIDADAFIGVMTLGWKGGVGDHVGYAVFVGLAGVTAFLAGVLIAFRDADPEAVAQLTTSGEIPPAARPTAPNLWPAAGAFGLGTLMFGLVTHVSIFIVGLVLVAAAAVEWMISAWADRATGDPVANRELRDRVMAPFEIPFLAVAAMAVLVLSASRIFLAVSELNAVWAAVALTTIVMGGAILLAVLPAPSKSTVQGILVLGAIVVIVLGIVSASIGQREIEHEEEGEETEEVSEEGAMTAEPG